MSKFLDKLSAASTKSELDLYTVPPTQVVVRRSFWEEVHLQNPCTNAGPYEFRIPPDMYMLQVSKNYVYIRLRIVRHDGAILHVARVADGANNIAAQLVDAVGPINLLGKTFFKQVKLSLNGKLVSDSSDKYAYRAFLETELNFGPEAKDSQLQAALYSKDRPTAHINDAGNVGWQERSAPFAASQWVELMAPIHADLFQQDRYLLNQTELRLEMYRNSDQFCLMTFGVNPEAFRIEVQQMCFYVKKIEVVETIGLAIETMFNTENAKYPIRRIQMSTMSITENRRSTPLNSLFSGALPRRLVIGLVASDALRGTYATSPFNFQPFGMTEIKITCGTTTVPSTPYTFDFATNRCIRAFVQLFEGLGFAGDDKGNGIDFASFKSGCCLFVFELGADGSDSSHWELTREGTVSLDIQFGAALPVGGVEVIIYAENDNLLMINKNRQTFTDYTA
jgi:hypothetical protein